MDGGGEKLADGGISEARSPEPNVKDKGSKRSMKSPKKGGSQKASPSPMKKDSDSVQEEAGVSESGLKERCQMLEKHLEEERRSKAQLVEQRKEKDATIAKLREAEKKITGKLEEEKRRAENAAERERKAKQEHDEMKLKFDSHDAQVKQVEEGAKHEIDALHKVLADEKLAKEKLELERDAADERDQKQRAELEVLAAKVKSLESTNANVARELQEALKRTGAESQEVEKVREEWEEKHKQGEARAKKQREISNTMIRKLNAEKDAEAQHAKEAYTRVEELEKENKKLVHESEKLRAMVAESTSMEMSLTQTTAALDARLQKADAKNGALVKEKEELLLKVSGLEKAKAEAEKGLAEERNGKAAALKELGQAREKLAEVERKHEGEVKELRAKHAEAAGMESMLTQTSAALDARLKKADEKNKGLLKEKAELLQKVAGLEGARVEAEQGLAEERAGKAAALKDSEEAREKLAELGKRLEEREGDVKTLRVEAEKGLREERAGKAAVLKEREDARAALAGVEKRLAECEREVQRVRAENAKLKESAQKLASKVEELKAEGTAAEAKNTLLVRSQEALEAVRRRLEAEVSDLKGSTAGLTADLDALKAKHASALEKSSGTEAEKQRMGEEIKGLVLERKTLTAQLQALREEKQVVVEQGTRHAKMKEALEAEKEQLGAELAQLLAKMQGPKSEAGAKQEAGVALRSVAAKVDELHEKLVDLEHRSELLAQAEEEREAAVRASAEKEAEIGRLREKVLSLEARAVEEEATVAELQEALQTAQAQLAKVTGFSRAKVEEIHGLRQRLQEAARDQEEHQELRRKVAEQMEAMLAAEARGRESEKAAKEAEEAARAQEDKLEQVEEALQRREEDVRGLKEQLRSKEAELETLRQQLEAEKWEGEKIRGRMKALETKVRESEEAAREEREHRDGLESELQKARREIEDLTSAASVANQRGAELEKRVAELDTEKMELYKRLRSEADARVRELAEKLAAAEAEKTEKMSRSDAEWAKRLSEAEAATADKLAAAEDELRAVRADLQRAKQELAEQKERWEREKCEQAERHAEELERVARERARTIEHLEKEVEESGGAIEKLREGITRRDVEISDLQKSLSEVRESLERAVRTKEEEERERAQSVEMRERLTADLARKDAEIEELRREIEEIHANTEGVRASSGGANEVGVRGGADDEVSRRKEELKLVERVVHSKEAAPSKVKVLRGFSSDPEQLVGKGETNRAPVQKAGKADARPKPPTPRVRLSFLERKEGSPGSGESDECSTPIQEKFEVGEEEKTDLQERLREKEEALESEMTHRQKLEKQLVDANSLLALRAAEASRLEQERRHVVALEEKVGALQQELAGETARASELTVLVADRDVELARLKDGSLQGTAGSREGSAQRGEEIKVEQSIVEDKERSNPSGREAASNESRAPVSESASTESAATEAAAAGNGGECSVEWLQRELNAVWGKLGQERGRAEATCRELRERVAERERELGEKTQELRNLEQQLEDEEGDKRKILSQMDHQRGQIDHLQQQLYGKKKSMDRLLTCLSDKERTLEQLLRLSPGQSPRASFNNGDPNGSPKFSVPSALPPEERSSSPKLPLTTSVPNLERLRAEAESEHQAEFLRRLELAGGLERRHSEGEVLGMVGRYKVLEAELDGAKKERAELQERAGALQRELAARDVEIAGLKEELERAKARSEADAGQEADARKVREEKEGALTRSVADLKARVAEKEKLLVDGDTKFEELRVQIKRGEATIRSLRGELGAVRLALSEKEDYVEREIGEQAKMLVQMRDDLTEKERQLTEWEGLAEANEKNVASLRKKLESLESAETLSTEARSGETEDEDAPRGSLREELEAALAKQRELGEELSAERREWESRLVRMRHEREELEAQVAEERKLKNAALKSVQVKLRRFHFEFGELRKERAALGERVQGLARVVREGEERVLAAVEEKLRGQAEGVAVKSPPNGWLEKLKEATKGKDELLAIDYKMVGSMASRALAATVEGVTRGGEGDRELAGASPQGAASASESGRTAGSASSRWSTDDGKEFAGGEGSGNVPLPENRSTWAPDDGSSHLRKRISRSSHRLSPRGSGETATISTQEESLLREEEQDQSKLVLVAVCTIGALAVFVVTARRLGFL